VNVPTVLHNLTFSPDQRQLLGSSAEPDQSGLWLVDLERDVPTRLVPGGGAAAWSADGAGIVFTAARPPAARGIYLRSTAGPGEDRLLKQTSEFTLVNDWSRDGRYIVYVSGNLRTKNDLWLLARSGDGSAQPFLATAANEIQAQVSPDGRWIAYASDESGRLEVYVQSFPIPGAKRAISTGGGVQPQWRGDGQELFYLSPNHMMMAVDVKSGATLQVGRPMPLFRAPVLGSLSDYRNYYAVTADGRRFLIDSVAADSPQEPITVLVNWTALIR
jgi:Tol biopolymer transport system component